MDLQRRMSARFDSSNRAVNTRRRVRLPIPPGHHDLLGNVGRRLDPVARVVSARRQTFPRFLLARRGRSSLLPQRRPHGIQTRRGTDPNGQPIRRRKKRKLFSAKKFGPRKNFPSRLPHGPRSNEPSPLVFVANNRIENRLGHSSRTQFPEENVVFDDEDEPVIVSSNENVADEAPTVLAEGGNFITRVLRARADGSWFRNMSQAEIEKAIRTEKIVEKIMDFLLENFTENDTRKLYEASFNDPRFVDTFDTDDERFMLIRVIKMVTEGFLSSKRLRDMLRETALEMTDETAPTNSEITGTDEHSTTQLQVHTHLIGHLKSTNYDGGNEMTTDTSADHVENLASVENLYATDVSGSEVIVGEKNIKVDRPKTTTSTASHEAAQNPNGLFLNVEETDGLTPVESLDATEDCGREDIVGEADIKVDLSIYERCFSSNQFIEK